MRHAIRNALIEGVNTYSGPVSGTQERLDAAVERLLPGFLEAARVQRQEPVASDERAELLEALKRRVAARLMDKWGMSRFYADDAAAEVVQMCAARAAGQRQEPCPYCASDNKAVRENYFDQTCRGCVDRMAAVADRQPAPDEEAQCAECGVALELVRPGKFQHPHCSQADRQPDGLLRDPEVFSVNDKALGAYWVARNNEVNAAAKTRSEAIELFKARVAALSADQAGGRGP
jgi:hypothetical protein